MNPAQLKAMQEGRARAERERRREAIARVRMFERWLCAGSILREIPTVPTDADYGMARQAGATKR